MKPEESLYNMKPEESLYNMKPEESLYNMKPEESLYNMKLEESLYNREVCFFLLFLFRKQKVQFLAIGQRSVHVHGF